MDESSSGAAPVIPAKKTLFEVVPALGAMSAHGGRVAKLRVAKLLPQGFTHPDIVLVEGSNTIGRDPGQNNHAIASTHVSRTHCEILVSAGEIQVKDLGSHNGTFVNGERVTLAKLGPGDRLGLSRRINFVLGMDQDLEQPIGVDLQDMEDKTRDDPIRPVEPAPAPPVKAAPAHSMPDADDDEPDAVALLRQAEQQRDVLAILYQVSLRCLMAEDLTQTEQLLTNVLQRLVQLDAGFILYQVGDSWRASVCPESRYRPADTTIKASYKLACRTGDVQVLEGSSDELARLGIADGAALLVPMMFNGVLNGVIGILSDKTGLNSAETIDIVMQLANVAAAALRRH